jgi:hypothetical protein
MKPVLAWMKKNLAVVISIAVIVISLPVAWFFSSSMNSKIKTQQQTKGDAAIKELSSRKSINYKVLIPEPGREPLAESAPPNEERINAYAAIKKQVDEQAAAVVTSAVDFNRGAGPAASAIGRSEFKMLVEGVFPGPMTDGKLNSDELEIKLREFEDAIVGKKGPNPYDQLLKSINAGGSQDAAAVAQSLGSLRATETEKVRAGTRELTKEETDALNKKMGEFRIGAYQARAREISVFATTQSLPNDSNTGRAIASPGLVRLYESEDLTNRHMIDFGYQWDLWLLSDVLNAVRIVNTKNGKPTEVANSVVKRIERMGLKELSIFGVTDKAADGEFGGTGGVTEVAGENGMAPFDPKHSITGRFSGKTNEVYEVREGIIVAVVSSARLREFIDAMSRSNFMTVIDLDLKETDVHGDLARGYYYGEEHVITATIRFETIWLRSWIAPLMPKAMRTSLGITLPGDEPVDPNAPAGAPGAAPTGTPAAAPAPTGGGRNRPPPGGG